MRGPGAGGVTPDSHQEPGGTLSRDALVRAAQKALCLVSDQRPTWTRHHLLKQLALVMPVADPATWPPGSAAGAVSRAGR